MKIIIGYNDSWSVTNLLGNQKTHFNKVRPQVVDKKDFDKENEKFEISKTQSFPRKDEITINTIWGILYRIVGDVRPLHFLLEKDHYLKFLENSLKFEKTDVKERTEHLTFQNIGNRAKFEGEGDKRKLTKKGYENPPDPSLWKGEINETNKFFTEKALYQTLLFPFVCKPQELYELIVCKKFRQATNLTIKDGRLRILSLDSEIKNDIKFSEEIETDKKTREEIMKSLKDNFKKVKYVDSDIKKYKIFIYSALYMCYDYLYQKYEMVSGLEDELNCQEFGNLQTSQNKWSAGISHRNITPKDLIARVANSMNVLTYPVENITVSDGVIVINCDIQGKEANQLKEMIEEANVGVFRVGKKGTAYIKEIQI